MTPPIQTILVATDFSPNARKALEVAVALAATHGASIRLVHAVHTLGPDYLPMSLQDEVARSMDQLVPVARAAQVPITTDFETGRPWRVIADAAHSADLTVVGARGRTIYNRLRLGSTADRILRTCPSPVFVVHPDDVDRLPIRTIVVGTDFSPEAQHAAEIAIALFGHRTPAPRVALVHAWEPPVQYEFGEAAGGHDTPSDEEATMLRQRLDQVAARLRPLGVDVDVSLDIGHPASVLERAAEDADLVAVGTRGLGGLQHLMLGSVAERLVHHVTCPVLAVRHAVTETHPSDAGHATELV